VASIPVVLITGLFTGMVLALQSPDAFGRFGADELVATVVSLSMLRELGPVLIGSMVAGGVGSAMAAELGTMRISEQIDALVTLGTNPVRYLIVPRLLASVLMMSSLVVFANAVGIFGGPRQFSQRQSGWRAGAEFIQSGQRATYRDSDDRFGPPGGRSFTSVPG